LQEFEMRRALSVMAVVVTTSLLTTGAASAASPAWKIQPTPNPSGDPAAFSAVSCPAINACTAVGWYDGGSGGGQIAIVEHAADTHWAIQGIPQAGVHDRFVGVSCPTPTACIAVGSYDTASTTDALAEAWNGKGWVVQPVPDPTPGLNATLSAVTCTTSTACTAVGTYKTDSGAFAQLVERWTGAGWTIEPAPAPTGAVASTLSAVSCPSSASCIAVGSSTNSSGVSVPLATGWNGKTWNPEPLAPPTGHGSALTAVSCTSLTVCDAVGWNTPTSANDPLVIGAVWNGTSWGLRTVPSPAGATSSVAHGVSCTGATDCVAVGSYVKGSVSHAFAAGWNGSVWALQTAKSPAGSTVSELLGVTCPTAALCVAAGDSQYASANEKTLVERRS
jgi:hypothetical protein